MDAMFKKSCLTSMFFFAWVMTSHALEVDTHKVINEYIAVNSINGFSIDSYLKIQLGLQNGISEKFNSLKAWEFMRDGGVYEDVPPEHTIPYRRSRNHFHDPTRLWDQSYYSGLGSFCDVGHCPESAILWAQGPQPINDIYNPGGNWSWGKVREYYYTSLSGRDYTGVDIAANKVQRNEYFAKIFRGVGQLMHLVQDMSVPAHVRNDGHAYGGYEGFVDNLRKTNMGGFLKLLSNPVTFDPSILSLPPDSLAPIPIAKIFDTDQYNNTQNTLSKTWGSDIGLAEYTNANFFSEDSIDSTQYNYPSRQTSSYYQCRDLSPLRSLAQHRWYLSRTPCAEGVIDHFLTKGIFTGMSDFVKASQWDDKVYESYAQNLLPRAVGYSAGLLKYFFRGNLQIATVDDYSVKVYNFSDEPLNSGVIELYYDDASDVRHWCGAFTLQSPIASGQDSGPISIDPAAITNNRRPGRYFAVFKGTLGGEDGAVIGGYRYEWLEDWDNGLKGNHPWLYTDTDFIGQNTGTGQVINEVSAGNLKMRNIREAGNTKPHLNQAYAGDAHKDGVNYCVGNSGCFPVDVGREFPIFVDNRTWMILKIDAMSSNAQNPGCINDILGIPVGAYQRVSVGFRLGDGSNKWVEFTVAGHGSEAMNRVEVPLGEIRAFYLYNMLKELGPIVEPVFVTQVSIAQRMSGLCSPSTEQHVQYMEIDHIGFFDGEIYNGPDFIFAKKTP